jgi:hypothetical protein
MYTEIARFARCAYRLVTVIAAEVVEIKASLRPEIQVAAQGCRVKKGGAFTGEVRLVSSFVQLCGAFLVLTRSELLGEVSCWLLTRSRMSTLISEPNLYIDVRFV